MLAATRRAVFAAAAAALPRQMQLRGLATASAATVKQLRQATGAPLMECKTALEHEDVQGDMEKAVAWLRKHGVQTAEKKAGRATTAGLVGVKVDAAAGVAAIVELNSETDFVARNEKFLDLMDTVLVAVISAKDLQPDPAAAHGVDALAVLGLGAGGGGGGGLTVRDTITNAVATMRENISLRRAARVTFNPASDVVSAYVHNSLGGGRDCGSSASLVHLRSSSSSGGGGGAAPAPAPLDALGALGKQLAMHVVAAKPKFLTTAEVPESVLQAERDILVDEARRSGKAEDKIQMMVNGRLNKFFGEIVLLKQGFVMDDKESVEKVVAAAGKKVRLGVSGCVCVCLRARACVCLSACVCVSVCVCVCACTSVYLFAVCTPTRPSARQSA
jgi:elongation factor Ts